MSPSPREVRAGEGGVLTLPVNAASSPQPSPPSGEEREKKTVRRQKRTQRFGRTELDFSRPTVFVSTGCPSHSGRQVADQNGLVDCSTHPEETGKNYWRSLFCGSMA